MVKTDKRTAQENSRKDDLNEYPRQGNEKPKVDLVGNVVDSPDQERLVKADDDNAPHLENMANVQGSNKDNKQRQKAQP
jgi:hypothetical protein